MATNGDGEAYTLFPSQRDSKTLANRTLIASAADVYWAYGRPGSGGVMVQKASGRNTAILTNGADLCIAATLRWPEKQWKDGGNT